MDMLGWQAEEESCSMISYEDKGYNQNMVKLCKLIASQLNIELNIKKDEKNGILNFLRKSVLRREINA